MSKILFVASVALIWLAPAAMGATFTVTSTADDGAGSLRQAIVSANATPEADTIAFAIGTGPQVIALSSALPAITQPLTVDGTTQPGFVGAPLIRVRGTVPMTGFTIRAADTTIRGLWVSGCRYAAIVVDETSTGKRIAGNWIGDPADQNYFGIAVVNGTNDPARYLVIGGTTAADRNVISGNTHGIDLLSSSAGASIQGNYIGTDSTGTIALGNDVGIWTDEPAPIGGRVAGAGNVISGNKIGVGIGGAYDLSIEGNLIGVAADGVTPLPNEIGVSSYGFVKLGAPENGAGNVIAYNTVAGIELAFPFLANLSNSLHHNAVAVRTLVNGAPQRWLNDRNDADDLTNHPVLASIERRAAETVIRGRLHGKANTTYTLQFFVNSPGSWQGETLLGTTTVTIGADHEALFTASVAPTPSCCITATATRSIPYYALPPWPATSFYSRGHTAHRDFNGDFKSDIWWRNSENGGNAIWFMDGTRVIGGRNLPPVGPEWTAIVADFDGDSESDVFWRHTVTGENAIWYLRNGYIDLSSGFIPRAKPIEWEPLAADVDGDTKAEIIWRNTVTGQQELWRMGHAWITWGATVPPMPGDWTRAAQAMDITGLDSILWRSASNAATMIWFMSTNAVARTATLPSVGDDWEMISGDFDGDTSADILWRNKATGLLSMWLLRDGEILAGGDLYPVGAPWVPIPGDYNGDGRTDIFWHRSDTGQNSLWLLDGRRIIGGGDGPYVPGAQWSAVP